MIFEAGASSSLINAIRRYVLEVPTLAIDEIEVFKNDSPLYDEMIAHRLGLITIKMSKSLSEKNTPRFKLSVKKEGTVHAKDLRGGMDVIFPNTPITVLGKGQELEIVAETKIGKGKEHSKFSPGIIFYREAGDIDGDKEDSSDSKKNSGDLVITVESFGQMGVKDIFLDSVKELKKDLTEFSKKVSKA